jgi:hypothetical protein
LAFLSDPNQSPRLELPQSKRTDSLSS